MKERERVLGKCYAWDIGSSGDRGGCKDVCWVLRMYFSLSNSLRDRANI